MKTTRTIVLSLAILIVIASNASAQYADDALRLAFQGSGFSARSLGLGMTYTGIASDYSAVFSNPAGLGQIKRNEVSAGLSYLSYGNDATFMGNTTSFSNSATTVNNVGLVYSVPTTQGSLVLAFGYGRSPDFTTGISFKGNNPNSSMVPSLYQNNPDLAYQLYLVDSLGRTPIQDSMQQRGKVLEDGGLNNWMLSGSIEAAENLFLGVTVTFISGSYKYTRDYSEYDVYNKYTQDRYGIDYALNNWDVVDNIDGSISGFTTRFGLLYKFAPHTRIGFSIKIPTYYTINENFSSYGTSVFDVPDHNGDYSYSYGNGGTTKYGVTTPFEFSGGFSIGADGIMLASDVQYTDWTQLEFTDTHGDPTLEQYNTDFKDLLTPTFNFHIGAEVHVPQTSLRLRGGFAYIPSPYKSDPTSYDQKYITGGLGVLLADVLMIDLGYAHGFWQTSHVNYDAYDANGTPLSQTQEKIVTNNVMATISYRF